MKAGFTGERIVDRHLEALELPESSIILTDIHLFLTSELSFQIDTLLLSKTSILILEVKNMAGSLRFLSDPHQLEQTHSSGKVTLIDCPIVQLENTKYYLQTWLKKQGIDVAVDGQIVLANKRSKVVLAPPKAPIVYLNRLRMYLEKLEKEPTLHNASKIQEISRVILKNQKPYNPYPLCEYFRIDPNSLKRGQLCSICSATMSFVNHKQRKCNVCHQLEANNYGQAITDWFLLINNTISNQECKHFLQLKNRDATLYALKSLSLNKIGNSVATRYQWPRGRALLNKD
ncbi:nuclease-related domain-containing protein [Sporosarcina sp. CAU 1771]